MKNYPIVDNYWRKPTTFNFALLTKKGAPVCANRK